MPELFEQIVEYPKNWILHIYKFFNVFFLTKFF
jgi:hypothetical protein